MRIEISMPRMGQSMEEGKVVTWLVPYGTEIKRGEIIAEIETDKAVIDLEAPADGILVEVAVPEGMTVSVGTPLAFIEDENGNQSAVEIATGRPPTEATPPAAETAATPELKPLSSADSATTTSSTNRVKSSPAARFLAAQHNIDLHLVKASQPERFVTKADVEAFMAEQQASVLPRRINISPVAKQYAEEHAVDLTQVTGTGPGGRIVRSDIESFLALQQQEMAAPIPSEEVWQFPLPKIKRTTARRMLESKTTIPHFYESIDIEVSRALALRESLKKREVEVTINDLILRATTLALINFPNLNATFADDSIQVHPHIHMAFAVSLDEGLITPVILHCESLSLADLAASSRALIDRARKGHLRPDDLKDGTFTVSNLGMYGIKEFQAIVNPPQAAILAVGGLRRLPVFDAFDRVVPAQMINFSVSADHRVTDGAEVARFLAELRRILEDGFALV